MHKAFFLTFDLEEFDVPKIFGNYIDDDDSLAISKLGTERIIPLLDEYDIKSTFFTTSFFASRYPFLIRKLSKKGHEIAFHGTRHLIDANRISSYEKTSSLIIGKEKIESITGKKLLGFRHPHLKSPSMKSLNDIGLIYDSSVHPTYIPGRYNNIRSRRDIHKIDDIFEVPISVTPILRLPFSWVWFRNMGLDYTKACTLLSSKGNDHLNIYFHPWDFVDISGQKVHSLIKRNTGEISIKQLSDYIEWCLERDYEFSTIKRFLASKTSL